MSEQTPEAVEAAPEQEQPEQRDDQESSETPVKPEDTVDYWKKRARQHEDSAKANAKELRKLQDAGKSELELATQRAEQAEARLSELETVERRTRIAAKHGITELAHRLAGSEEEMTSFAKELAKFKGSTVQQEQPSFDGGPRTPATRGKNMNDLIRQAAGRA